MTSERSRDVKLPGSPGTRPRTRILVDGGDPAETSRIKDILGYVDGQTTNPSLIAHNPDVRLQIASGRRFTRTEQTDAYREIVSRIAPLVGDAGVSIEVFADLGSTAEDMVAQGVAMFGWIPNAYIKYPCTKEGIRAAEISVRQDIRVNMTLCFSQQQAAAVYGATKGTKAPAYVSPFVGRLDDFGQNGVDLLANIQHMFEQGDGHVLVLAASIRSLEHLLYCFSTNVALVTAPAKILEQWARAGSPQQIPGFKYNDAGNRIAYEDLDLDRPWTTLDLEHPLTRKGITKFVEDYQSTLSIRKAS